MSYFKVFEYILQPNELYSIPEGKFISISSEKCDFNKIYISNHSFKFKKEDIALIIERAKTMKPLQWTHTSEGHEIFIANTNYFPNDIPLAYFRGYDIYYRTSINDIPNDPFKFKKEEVDLIIERAKTMKPLQWTHTPEGHEIFITSNQDYFPDEIPLAYLWSSAIYYRSSKRDIIKTPHQPSKL